MAKYSVTSPNLRTGDIVERDGKYYVAETYGVPCSSYTLHQLEPYLDSLNETATSNTHRCLSFNRGDIMCYKVDPKESHHIVARLKLMKA